MEMTSSGVSFFDISFSFRINVLLIQNGSKERYIFFFFTFLFSFFFNVCSHCVAWVTRGSRRSYQIFFFFFFSLRAICFHSVPLSSFFVTGGVSHRKCFECKRESVLAKITENQLDHCDFKA